MGANVHRGGWDINVMNKVLVGAAAAAAFMLSAQSASAALTLDTNPCTEALLLTSGCLFSGGNVTETSGPDIDALFNGQLPQQFPLLDLSSFTEVQKVDSGGTDADGTVLGGQSGIFDASFLVSFYAVKAGNQFQLYKVAAPSSSFSWTTADLQVGSGQQPNVSHLTFWGSAGSTVPEPATWAMMIMGFGLAGTSIRSARRARMLAA